MDHRGMELNKIFGTVHHPGHSGGNADGGTTVISGATTGFHKYTAEWTAAAIKFYVDDQLFYTFPNTGSLPFNSNFFIIMNVAIGGTFGGPVDPAITNATMEVDYVRVYR
jgi:beta-glucanase (GH16 family)